MKEEDTKVEEEEVVPACAMHFRRGNVLEELGADFHMKAEEVRNIPPHSQECIAIDRQDDVRRDLRNDLHTYGFEIKKNLSS